MNDFIISARKYRPQRFRDVVGQEHVVKTLQNAIKSNQVASAFLFCGLKGSGKTSSARLLAKAINCDVLTPEGEPCNTCSYCTQKKLLNIHELDAASHNSADDMRQIADQTRYLPSNGKKMVIIIDEAHMLSNAALNVLLKPLEDTPKHVVFILVTTEKHKIIPTILSRCQVFDFHHIKPEQIIAKLIQVAEEEQIAYETEALALISQQAGGSLRDALSMFDLIVTFSGDNKLSYKTALVHLNLLDESMYLKITDALYQGTIGEALLIYDKIVREGFDSYQFLNGLGQHFRNLLMAQQHKTLELVKIRKEMQETYSKKAQTMKTAFLYQALDLVHRCALDYKKTINQRLHVEVMLINIGQLYQSEKARKLPSTDRDPATLPSASYPKEEIISHPPTHLHNTHTSSINKPSSDTLVNTTPKETLNEKPVDTQKKLQKSPDTSEIKKNPVLHKETKHTVRIPNRREIRHTISQKHSEKTVEATQKTPTILVLEKVQELWKTYAIQLKEQENRLHYTILQQPITIQDHCIIVQLANTLQQHEFKTIHADLLTYLRQALSYPKLTIRTEVAITPTKKQLYSDQEKLADLIQKYPTVGILQEKLELKPL